MTQKLIDTLFQITVAIHQDIWFGKRRKRRDRKEVQEWISRQLDQSLKIYTIPCGSSWGVLTSKDEFDKYWLENSKIKSL